MKSRKPAWWQLYLFVPMMLALWALLHLAHLTASWEEIGDIGLVVLTFGGMLVWVQWNEVAIDLYDMERESATRNPKITVYEHALEPEGAPTVSHVLKHFESSRRSSGIDGRPTPDLEQEDKWLLN